MAFSAMRSTKSEVLQLTADIDSRAADDVFVHSIATVVSSSGADYLIGDLTAPSSFALSCSRIDALDILKMRRDGGICSLRDDFEADGIQYYVIRTVPLSVEFIRPDDGGRGNVEALCPVAIDCVLPETAPRPSLSEPADGTIGRRDGVIDSSS